MTWPAVVRRLIPLSMRQEIRHHWRRLQDMARGVRFDNARGALTSERPIRLVQPIMPGAFYENKIANIARGAALLDQNRVAPLQSWSFWHRVRRPGVANGFVTGRNLVSGDLVAQTGGGLCQLSSMVYHLALLAGLTIVERHPHSVDIYEEHQRFTPLGADATVVWGYKDLRLYNPHPFAVSFKFAVQDSKLLGEVAAEMELTAQQVDFVRIPLEKPFVKINTVVNNSVRDTTIYLQKQGLQTVSAT